MNTNLTHHTVTKYPPAPAYLKFGQLPYPSVLGNGNYYPTIEEAKKEKPSKEQMNTIWKTKSDKT